jgi:flagellar biosynthetic protein FlhB
VSEGPDKDSKTEAPTPKRLDDAVEKGDTPFSREATAFGAISAMLIGAWVLVPQATERLSVPLRGLLANAGDIALSEPGKLRALVSELSMSVGAAIAPLLFVLCLFAFGTAAFQNVPNAALERIEPKLSRISLKEGFKRFYGIPFLKEFAKSLFKFAVAGFAVFYVFSANIREIEKMLTMDIVQIPVVALGLFTTLMIAIAAGTAILAVADILFVRHEWYENQKMTRQEVMDELKQSEGDPRIRLMARSLARKRSKRRMIASVAEATLVIANPVHFAVALRYEKGRDMAPVVVAKGQDSLALKIKAAAAEHSVRIFEDPPLARSLYRAVDVDREIPPEFYAPVANLIRILYEKKKA